MNLNPQEPEALAIQIAEKLFELQIQPVWVTERAMKITGKKTVKSSRTGSTDLRRRPGAGTSETLEKKFFRGHAWKKKPERDTERQTLGEPKPLRRGSA